MEQARRAKKKKLAVKAPISVIATNEAGNKQVEEASCDAEAGFRVVIFVGMTRSRTVKVGPKGQVVIPKVVREQLGIRPGAQVRVDRLGDEVRVRPVSGEHGLRGLLRDGASTAELEAAREADRDREPEREGGPG